MTSKTHQIAQLAALLAVNTKCSAYTCAELAIKLHGLGEANTKLTEWGCNGYKNEWQDKHLNKTSRENPSAANEYAKKLWDEGEAYTAKRSASIEKKLEKICADTGLNIKPCGLSGLVWHIDTIREYYI